MTDDDDNDKNKQINVNFDDYPLMTKYDCDDEYNGLPTNRKG